MGAMKALEITRSEQIAHLNDKLRKHNQGGFWAASERVHELPKSLFNKILLRIKRQRSFKRAGKVSATRDYGSLSVEGHKLVWHIDYLAYGRLSLASPDPASEEATTRRLVIRFENEVDD
jgi:Protein of unknown function (DUF3768)